MNGVTKRVVPVPRVAERVFDAAGLSTASGDLGVITLNTFLTKPRAIDAVGRAFGDVAAMLPPRVVVYIRGKGGLVVLVKLLFEAITDRSLAPFPVVSRASALTRVMYAPRPGASDLGSEFARLYGPAVNQSVLVGEQFTGPVLSTCSQSEKMDTLATRELS